MEKKGKKEKKRKKYDAGLILVNTHNIKQYPQTPCRKLKFHRYPSLFLCLWRIRLDWILIKYLWEIGLDKKLIMYLWEVRVDFNHVSVENWIRA